MRKCSIFMYIYNYSFTNVLLLRTAVDMWKE